jgi:hypothetical protein
MKLPNRERVAVVRPTRVGALYYLAVALHQPSTLEFFTVYIKGATGEIRFSIPSACCFA